MIKKRSVLVNLPTAPTNVMPSTAKPWMTHFVPRGSSRSIRTMVPRRMVRSTSSTSRPSSAISSMACADMSYCRSRILSRMRSILLLGTAKELRYTGRYQFSPCSASEVNHRYMALTSFSLYTNARSHCCARGQIGLAFRPVAQRLGGTKSMPVNQAQQAVDGIDDRRNAIIPHPARVPIFPQHLHHPSHARPAPHAPPPTPQLSNRYSAPACKYGLLRRSRPMVVDGPWPGWTA